MLFSVIVPTYKQEEFIVDTLSSIRSQGVGVEREVIVVDGGCSDKVAEIVSSFNDPRITLISERDSGQGEAINKGMRAAKGDVLCWLNSDDLLMPNALSRVAEFFTSSPKADVLYGDAILFNEAAGNCQYHRAIKFDEQKFTYSDFIVQPSCFWRRTAWEATGPINESLHFVMDWDWFLRASRICTFAYLPSCLSLYRLHANHKTGSKRAERTVEVCDLIRRHGSKEVVAALNDVLPIANRLDATCQFLAKHRLIPLRKLFFPGLYLKHDRRLIHDILGSIL